MEGSTEITGGEGFEEQKDKDIIPCILRSPGIRTRILESDSEPGSRFCEK